MANASNLSGIEPNTLNLITAIGECLLDNVAVVIDTANVTEAANDTWSKLISFRIVGGTSGNVIPLNGVVGASIALTTGSGPVPAVSSATPTVVNGYGTVTALKGNVGGGSYAGGDICTLTITYTNLQGGTDTDTWTITFS
jgi:hypothetical protein